MTCACAANTLLGRTRMRSECTIQVYTTMNYAHVFAYLFVMRAHAHVCVQCSCAHTRHIQLDGQRTRARALVPRPPSLPASHIIAQLHAKRNGLSHAWIACWPAMPRKRVSARYRGVGIFRDVFTNQKPSTLSFSKRTKDGTPLKPTHHTQCTHARC